MLQNSTTATITKQKTTEKAWRPLFRVKEASFESWLECRTRYITGTDAGTIAGVNKYQTPYQLYMEKKGLIKRQPPNSAMIWGRRMEPVIRQAYAEETGYEVKEIPYMLVSTKYPWMAGNLDGAVRLPSGEWAVLEIKNLGPYTGSTEYANGDSTGYASPSHVLQCYHYAILVGCRKMVLCACISGQKLIHQIIEYDDATANALIELEHDFYYNYLQKNIAPPVTGQDASLLSSIYSKPESKEIKLPESAEKLVADYLVAAQEIKRWQEQKDLAEAQIKEMMKDNADTAIVGNQRISWKPVETKKLSATIARRFLSEDQVAQCTSVTASRRFSISTIKSKAK